MGKKKWAEEQEAILKAILDQCNLVDRGRSG